MNSIGVADQRSDPAPPAGSPVPLSMAACSPVRERSLRAAEIGQSPQAMPATSGYGLAVPRADGSGAPNPSPYAAEPALRPDPPSDRQPAAPSKPSRRAKSASAQVRFLPPFHTVWLTAPGVNVDEESGVFVRQPIAILDSGVGGLTVVKEVMRQLPRERIVYFGDTGRAPYGPRPAEEVIRFTREIVEFLARFDPKLIVVACNTATAYALEAVRPLVKAPVVGVILPGARAAVRRTKTGTVGVIGTEGTIRSGAYERVLKSLSPRIEVVSLACPTFVPIVERGAFRSAETYRIVAESLEPLRRTPIDTLILGCTHYPFLADAISAAMGPDIALISSAEETAREISAMLQESERLSDVMEVPVHQFYCSGDSDLFQTIARQWLREQTACVPIVWQVPCIR